MKEYKIITLTPTSNSTVKSMEGYVKSCETSLNKLAKEGWTLVCTESIPQQEMSNLILFMEREVSELHQVLKEEMIEIKEEIVGNAETFLNNTSSEDLPKN